MNFSLSSLADIQRTMAAAVMMPLTDSEEMQSHAADGRPMADVAAQFISPNSRLTAFERLEIYNRQYWFRVLGSLAEDFPALRMLLGTDRFHALSVAYLKDCPSRSFTLRNLGSQLADWLIAHPGYAGRRHRIAIELARVEWAFVEAFDNAELAPLTPEEIVHFQGGSCIRLQPHVQLLEIDYPADELAVALHDSERQRTSEAATSYEDGMVAPVSLRKIRKRKTWVAAHRVDLAVFYRRLSCEEYHILVALRDGRTLAEALEAGFAGSAMPMPRRAQAIQECFSAWAELGWLCAFDVSTRKEES